ncbi:DUF6562 domain-containing protein [Bacteroides sp.]
MKKNHFYLWLIALAGLITSCSQDETDALTAGESNRVSFTASLPQDFAQPGTRALPTPPYDNAGNPYKLRCILEVWSKDLSTLIVRKEEVPAADATDIKFEFELANPADYKALFWADYITPNARGTSQTTPNSYTHYQDNSYTTTGTDGLKAVETLNYLLNPLMRDAFFACKDFTKGVGALTNFNVTLTRPLAKLTIAEKNATNFGYCKQVNVTLDIPNTLNVATGAVSGTRTITNLFYSKPEDGGFSNDITINSNVCKTLFVNYIFAGNDDTAREITLEFIPADGSGKTLKSVTIPAGIPLKRNYCTNAAGSLIVAEDAPSPNTEMTVDINSDWNTPDVDIDAFPKVGYYYYKDGTWSSVTTKATAENPIIGVVYKVFAPGDPMYGKAHGKVVSLAPTDKLPWAVRSVMLYLHDSYGGKANTETILADKSDDLDAYQIFKACKEKREADGKEWYIPVKGEYGEICYAVNNSSINTNIEAAGGTAFVLPVYDTVSSTGNPDTYYWTSSEDGAGAYYLYNYDESGATTGRISKSTEYMVRFILDF